MNADGEKRTKTKQSSDRGAASAAPGPKAFSEPGQSKSRVQPKSKAGLPPAKAKAEGAVHLGANSVGGRRVGVPTGPARDAFTRWSEFFKTHKDSPEQLLNQLAMWRLAQMKGNAAIANSEIEGILKAYLTHNGKYAESWMYEQLAVAIELNKGSGSEVKESLDWAAELAGRRDDPNAILSVVDLLMLRGYTDTVGPPHHVVKVADLIKRVAEKVPHHDYPLLMGMLLASKRKDPALMAWSFERLLSLGWMLSDDEIRKKVNDQVTELADDLRKHDHTKDADALVAKLAEASTRDLVVRMTWKGYADLDLQIDEPLGATAMYLTPRTVFGGSIIKNGFGKHPEEVYVCPRAFDGDYVIRIDRVTNDPKDPATSISVETIVHEGTKDEQRQTYQIDLEHLKPIHVQVKGGRRTTALPFLGQPSADDLIKMTAPRPKIFNPKNQADTTRPDPAAAAKTGRTTPANLKPAH